MANQMSKQVFGVTTPATAARIVDSDKVAALRASSYRYNTRLQELELQFEAKAAELREDFLTECEAIHNGEAA